MRLVSVSKSQRAKAQLVGATPFFNQVSVAMSEILSAHADIESPFLIKRSEGRSLCLVIAGDKGMAGPYNNNIIKFTTASVEKSSSTLLVAGFTGRSALRRRGFDVDADFTFPVMNPNLRRARDVSEILTDRYLNGGYNEVIVIFTFMESAMRQEPRLLRVLPLRRENFLDGFTKADDDADIVKYEPDATTVFNHITPHYVTGVTYGAFVEAFSSEQQARIMAMDNATKSADDIISRLSLEYNRARQALITREITEIVSGMPD
jgi:F-type H+-transporting ATPase subunit gamma